VTSRGRRAQVVDRPGGDDPAAVDDHDVLAHVLHQVELVAREDDADAGRRALAKDRRHRLDAERVEAAERLVENEQLRIVDQGRPELDALLVAVRQGLELGAGAVGEPEPVEPARRRGLRLGRRQAMLLGEVAQLVGDLHPRVQAALLGHVAEPETMDPVDRPALPSDRAAIRSGEPEHAAHRRRLTGAVRPQEPDQTAGPDGERGSVERDDGPVALRQVGDLEQRVGPRAGSRWVDTVWRIQESKNPGPAPGVRSHHSPSSCDPST